jgi:UPF0755 protein
VPHEGALLPETFIVERGSPRQAIVDRMQTEARKLLDTAWTQHTQDLPLRLKQKMRLQSDPTILYGLSKGKTDWTRPIKRDEIIQTPYNTYQIDRWATPNTGL